MTLQVLYLDLRRDEGLQSLLALAAAARSHFLEETQLLLQGDQEPVPHVTVAKISKLLGRPRRVGVAAAGQPPCVAGSSNCGNGGGQGRGGGQEGELKNDWQQHVEGHPRQLLQPEENSQHQQLEQPSETQHLDPPPEKQQQQPRQQPRQRQQQDWRRIPAEAWAQHAGVSAGRVVLSELQLCAMAGRQNGNYYTVLTCLPLVR